MENTVSCAGHAEFGPEQMLPADLGLDELLAGEADGFWETVHSASSSSVPDTAKVVAPIDSQDVWAAGVTYAPSRDARMSESPQHASVYDSVFGAMRPELFYKSSGERVRGPDEEIAVRSDSTWNVPEPELALVLAADCNIVAVTIGNDVSSREASRARIRSIFHRPKSMKARVRSAPAWFESQVTSRWELSFRSTGRT